MWWCAPVVPAIQEAELGGSLETEVAVSHDGATRQQMPSLGNNRVRPCLKKNKRETKRVSTKGKDRKKIGWEDVGVAPFVHSNVGLHTQRCCAAPPSGETLTHAHFPVLVCG